MADGALCSATVDGRREDRFPYFDDRDAPDGSGEFLLPSVLLRRFAPWVGGLHGGCAWYFWSYAPLLSNITLRQRCVEVEDDRKMVSSGYAKAAGLLMALLCFLPIWAAEYTSRKYGVPIWVWTDSFPVVGIWASCDSACYC